MEAWSRFWRQGHATTFGDYFDKGYAGPVKEWLDTSAPELIRTLSRGAALERCWSSAAATAPRTAFFCFH